MKSLGVDIKVMQELMRHSSLRSTLDVYTQAVGPAKRAAQAAGRPFLRVQKGTKMCLFAPSNVRRNGL